MTVQPSPEHASETTSLPVYLTHFVGREQECATLSNLLTSQRLLSLTGTGGIGKTRLAIQVAAQVAPSFPDGLYVVELATILTPELLPYAIASVVGIPADLDIAPLPLLITALGQSHTLLLLDNCEHILAGCAPLVEALLQACPNLRILITSREPLMVAGETVWRVVALSSPAPTQTLPIEQLLGYEAIQLFCERAVESSPRFRLTPHNAPAVRSICSQLDGLPLALELAAALLPIFSVEQLATHLSERFDLLRHGKRTAHTRQQTLQATLDWSYDLLTSIEQAVFQRLAIFAGSWNLDAVKHIAALPETSDTLVIEVLVHLVNKSLVLAEEQESLEPGTTQVRYRLLDTMRMYTQDKLQQAGLWEQLCALHAEWYLNLAEQANEHLQGDDALLWFDLLEREMTNFRAALTRSLANGQFDTAARLAGALQRFWITHNHFSEGRHWFETLLTQQGNTLSPTQQTRILFGASEFARYQGAYDRACSLLQEEMTLLDTLDDAPGHAEALTCFGIVTGLKGDYEQGIQFCQRGLAAYRELDYQPGICTALTTLAFLTLAQGNATQAIPLSQEAIRLLRTTGHRTHLLYSLFTLAQAALFQEDRILARTTCQEAIQLAQALQHTYGLAASLGLIAGLASLEGQSIQAARFFGAAQALQTRIKTPHPPAGRALLERMVFSLRATLGAEVFLTHFIAGQQCSLEQILQEATAFLHLLSSTAQTTAASTTPASSVLAVLSQREREVLTLVATGLTDIQVAQYLVLSPRTVSKHLQSIYTKLHINSRSAATRLAFEEGLI